MGLLTIFVKLFVIAIGVMVALVVAFFIIWPQIQNYLLKINSINEDKELSKYKLQLRFAAYERLILLLSRISPEQVMLRNHQSGMNLIVFKQVLITDVENEFQHNYTQQLYVSDKSWVIVRDLKESTVSLFRNAGKGLSEDSSIDEYITIVLRHVKELEVDPYEAAQIILKKELST